MTITPRPRSLALRVWIRPAAVMLVLAAAGVASPQPPKLAEPFAPVAFLVGRWEGTSEGQPGKGTLRREYERVLNGRFIRLRNRSDYPVQDKNPRGEIHEDEGYFSFDRARQKPAGELARPMWCRGRMPSRRSSSCPRMASRSRSIHAPSSVE